MKKIVIVIGPPGSGKGTQAKKIATKYGYKHISTGDLLRGLATRQNLTDDEKDAVATMKTGQLVPDAMIYKLAFTEIEQNMGTGRGVVLDGAIRNVAQAAAYDAFFAKKGYTNEVMVFDITLSDEESFRRLTTRRMCGSCGEIIPAYVKDVTVCPKCSGELVTRSDDNAEVVHNRIAVQGNESLEPIREYYNKQGIVASINGEQSIAAIEGAIDGMM